MIWGDSCKFFSFYSTISLILICCMLNVKTEEEEEEEEHITMSSESNEDKGGNINRRACASCKHQRRKCRDDSCSLYPYFPVEKSDDFEVIHKCFGVSNLQKNIKDLEEDKRQIAVDSFVWAARAWKEDPVLGPLGLYRNLERQFEQAKHQLRNYQAQLEAIMQQQLVLTTDLEGVVTDYGDDYRKDLVLDIPRSSYGDGLLGVNPSGSNFPSSLMQESTSELRERTASVPVQIMQTPNPETMPMGASQREIDLISSGISSSTSVAAGAHQVPSFTYPMQQQQQTSRTIPNAIPLPTLHQTLQRHDQLGLESPCSVQNMPFLSNYQGRSSSDFYGNSLPLIMNGQLQQQQQVPLSGLPINLSNFGHNRPAVRGRDVRYAPYHHFRPQRAPLDNLLLHPQIPQLINSNQSIRIRDQSSQRNSGPSSAASNGKQPSQNQATN